ncbi:asparagine--tRNA ligase, partial [Klebsiella pneumoniae]|nr:asparagine--tRNA ligase [Klebsiella pneumoniae]
MSVVPVADVIQGRVAVDSEVTVRGWGRTRRASKAGFSFPAVTAGSCLVPVQPVFLTSLP